MIRPSVNLPPFWELVARFCQGLMWAIVGSWLLVRLLEEAIR